MNFAVDLREQRATRFANMTLALLRDFLPSHRDVQTAAFDALYEVAYRGNLEIIEVPPECDHLTKMQLEAHALETHPLFTVVLPATASPERSAK